MTTPEESTTSAPTHLYLIRHGQAVVNVVPIIGGMKGDTGLTDLGVSQAELLRDRLQHSREIRPDVLIASSLPRARQTAEIIAPAFNLPVVLDDTVQELRPGPDGDGLSIDEYRRRFGWVDFSIDPSRAVDPGGESWVTFMQRVSGALTRIAAENEGKTIVVVTHGCFIDGSFLHFFGLELGAVPPAGFATPNTSITHWERVRYHARMRWRLARYNDDTHAQAAVGRGVDAIDYTSLTPVEPAAPTETSRRDPT